MLGDGTGNFAQTAVYHTGGFALQDLAVQVAFETMERGEAPGA